MGWDYLGYKVYHLTLIAPTVAGCILWPHCSVLYAATGMGKIECVSKSRRGMGAGRQVALGTMYLFYPYSDVVQHSTSVLLSGVPTSCQVTKAHTSTNSNTLQTIVFCWISLNGYKHHVYGL
jgi:hypothetical protein